MEDALEVAVLRVGAARQWRVRRRLADVVALKSVGEDRQEEHEEQNIHGTNLALG